MPNSFPQFVRDGLLRPRIAARYLLDLNLSMSVIAQAAVLLAVLSTLALFFIYDLMERYSTDPIEIVTPPLLISIFVQLVFIALCSYVVTLLSPAFGKKVPFRASAAIFVWFNLLQLAASVAGLLTVLLFGLLAFFVPIIPLIWTIWAIGKYWGELVENESNFMGFVLVVAAILITLPILGLLVALLGLPTAGVLTDV